MSETKRNPNRFHYNRHCSLPLLALHTQKSVFKARNDKRSRLHDQADHQQPHGRPAGCSDSGGMKCFWKPARPSPCFYHHPQADNKTASTSTRAPDFSVSSSILAWPSGARLYLMQTCSEGPLGGLSTTHTSSPHTGSLSPLLVSSSPASSPKAHWHFINETELN